MKIKFLKDCGFTVVEQVIDNKREDVIEDYDESFSVGEIFEGDIVDDHGNYVSFQFGDGSMIFGLKKELYEVVEEN